MSSTSPASASAILVSRRRSVSAASPSNNRSSGLHHSLSSSPIFNNNNNNKSHSKTQILAEEHKHRQEIINALKNVAIPGVTVNEQIKEGEEYLGDDDASILVASNSAKFSSTAAAATVGKKVGIAGLLSSTNRKKSSLPVASEEVQDLTEADHVLLSELDVNELAPLLAFLKQTAPEVYGELPQRFTPEVAEEIILHLISGSDDLSGSSPPSRLRKRGATTASISTSQVRGLALAVSHFAHHNNNNNNNNNQSVTFAHHNGDIHTLHNNNDEDHNHENPSIQRNPLNQFDSPHQQQQQRSSSALFNTSQTSNSNYQQFDDDEDASQQGSLLLQNNNNHQETTEEKLARFERESAEREQKIQAVLNGVKDISRRHRERTLKLRIDNKDIGDVAVQTVASPGIKVVTTTGRPPPSHAVDAVGGIKQQMKTTHGEPPLMVLRQELEDRQALAAAMPRIRARVAEIMGKLSKQNHPGRNSSRNNNNASSASSNRPNSATTMMTPPSKRTRNAHVGNFFADNENLANKTASSSSPGRGGRNDRDISDIARRLRMRSESVNAAAERQQRETMEKRRAASQLRRDLVNQGVWVDVRILSMFRPPAQMKAFVASWSEFKSMIVQAVSPLPPGCVVASLSYLSGPGSKSVIDPRHPLLRPLRGFEVVRGCKSKDGTCAALTISIAIRSSGEHVGLPHDFEV